MSVRRSLAISSSLLLGILASSCPDLCEGAVPVQVLGGVSFNVRRAVRDGETYSIEFIAKSQGKDLKGALFAGSCPIILGTGTTHQCNYVSVGEASGGKAQATLLGGYEVPMVVRWNLKDPSLIKLPRVTIVVYLDGAPHNLVYRDLPVDVPRS